MDNDFGTHSIGDSIAILFELRDRGDGLLSFYLSEEDKPYAHPLNSFSYGGYLGEAKDEMLLHFVQDTLYEERISTSDEYFVHGIFSEISEGDTITLLFDVWNEEFRFDEFRYKIIVGS